MKNVTLLIPSSISALTIGLVFFILIFTLSPLTAKYSGTLYSWSYLLFSIIFLYFGLIFGCKKVSFKTRKIQLSVNVKVLKKIFMIIFIIALVGVILRIVDKYYIRGASFSIDFESNRLALSLEGAGFISIVSAMLYPFSFIVIYYYLFLKRLKEISLLWLFVVAPISLFPVIDGIFFGSRSSSLAYLVLTFLYLFSLNFIKIKFNLKTIVVFLLLSAMFYLSGLMFSFRSEALGIDPILSTQISAYAEFVTLDPRWTDFLYSIRSEWSYYFYLGVINFAQYWVHGVFELLYMVDNFISQKATLGGASFFIIFKFFAVIFGFNLDFIADSEVRSGVFITFFGSSYYDFLYFGVIFNFIFGFFVGRLEFKLFRLAKVGLIPIYFFMLIILLFSLVVSFLTGAQGIYIIVAAYLSHLIANRYLFKKHKIGFNFD